MSGEPVLRASSLNMASVCPAYPTQGTMTTGATSRGTEIHAQIEAVIKGDAPCPPSGPVFEAIRYGHRNVWGGSPYGVECEVELKYMGLVGHVDVLVRRPGGDTVIDWKTGQWGWYPDINDDLQMVAYAALASGEDRRVVHVHRVHVEAPEKTQVLRHDPRSAEGRDRVERLQKVIERSSVLNPEFRTGPHCETCLARHDCQALAPEINHLIGLCRGVNTNRDLARYATLKAAIVAKMAQADRELRRRLSEGERFAWGDYELVQSTRGKITVGDWKAVERFCNERWGWEPKARTVAELRSAPADDPIAELIEEGLVKEELTNGPLRWVKPKSPLVIHSEGSSECQ